MDQSPGLGGQQQPQREPSLGGDARIALLLEAIRSEDEETRQNALASLEQIGTSQALEIVLEALADSSELVQRRAIRALGRFPGSRSLEILEQLVLNEAVSYEIQREAGYALIDQGEAAREIMYRAWQELQSRGVRWSPIPHIPNLLRYGLAQLHDQRIVPNLLRELREHHNMTSWLDRCLAQYGAAMGLLLLEANEQAESIMRFHIRDIIEQCSEWYSSRFLKIEVRGYRMMISYVLGEFRDPALAPIFAEHLMMEAKDGFRDQYLARALGHMNDVRTVPVLLDVLQRPHFVAMLWAAEALYAIEGAMTPEVETTIMGVIQDWLVQHQVIRRHDDFSQTIWVIQFLGRTGSERAVPVLADKLADDYTNLFQFERGHRSARVGDMAAQALEQIGTPAALVALAEYRAVQNEPSRGEQPND